MKIEIDSAAAHFNADPKAGKGYRKLRVGETIKNGDQCWLHAWINSCAVGERVAAGDCYRRKR